MCRFVLLSVISYLTAIMLHVPRGGDKAKKPHMSQLKQKNSQFRQLEKHGEWRVKKRGRIWKVSGYLRKMELWDGDMDTADS